MKLSKVKIFFIAFFVLLLGAAFWLYNANYSQGMRAGYPVKISRKGFIFSTYEGQLNLGTYAAGGTGSQSNLWEFTVPDNHPEVVEAIEKASLSGKRIGLHYHEKMFKYPWRGDTKYMIYQVDTLD